MVLDLECIWYHIQWFWEFGLRPSCLCRKYFHLLIHLPGQFLTFDLQVKPLWTFICIFVHVFRLYIHLHTHMHTNTREGNPSYTGMPYLTFWRLSRLCHFHFHQHCLRIVASICPLWLLLSCVWHRGCEVVPFWAFDWHFPKDYGLEGVFMCWLTSVHLLWRNVYSNLLPIFWWVSGLLVIYLRLCFQIFNQVYHLQVFSAIL